MIQMRTKPKCVRRPNSSKFDEIQQTNDEKTSKNDDGIKRISRESGHDTEQICLQSLFLHLQVISIIIKVLSLYFQLVYNAK